MLTGKSEWCKEGIECTETKMADIGCGLGVSAVNLIAQIVDIYEAEQWILGTPIQFDLFDIDPLHQPILRALAGIVNAAYPQYFHITTGVRDVTEFVGVDKHDIVFSLHSMHYIPESKWPLAISNIEETMKENAILLIATDYVKESDELFFTRGVSLDELVIITNKRCDFLNADTAYEPGKICDSTMIDSNRFGETIKSEGVTMYRNTPGRLTPASISLNEIKEKLKRTRTLVLWPYCFNERSLPTAVMQSIPTNKLEITHAGWTSELLKNLDGSPSSAGIQLVKKSSVAEA
ncbi:MAG: class I SAM-dependent methyltransferase [Proteobacteria bacterium]|nr:class I SAM-dependent methyltransferase [Pseudomonadota bacterium]